MYFFQFAKMFWKTMRLPKCMCGNSKSFMTKTLTPKIMLRTYLRKRFLKNHNALNKKSYNKQRNLYVSLLRKEKKRQDFANLNENRIKITKHFGRQLILFLPLNFSTMKESLY